MNGRSVEVQLMRKLLAGRFVWDVKYFQVNFRKNFLPFFAQDGSGSSESFIARTATELFNSACCLNRTTLKAGMMERWNDGTAEWGMTEWRNGGK